MMFRLLGTLLQSINGLNQNGVHGASSNSPDSPLQLFAQLLNPANAAHGDAVYTEEALDRVITQFMEQANGTSAPGPASADAISRLPKKAVDKVMMGNDGKAECSVCMDNVNIGDEVTVLPCGHWFHGECVGAWLKEHDTCPHCRQGIMPQDTQANGPRAPGEPPRNAQSSSTSPGLPGGRGVHIVNMTLPSGGPRTTREQPRPQDHRRRSSVREGRNGGEGSSNGSSGGLSGWVRDRLGRGSGDRS